MKYEIISEEGYPIKMPNGKLVYIENRDGPILSEFPDVLIIPMKIKNDDPENNFIGLNEQGEVIWRFNLANHLGVKHKFDKAWVSEEGDLWIKNLAGKEYKLDHKTGEILEKNGENIDFDYNDSLLRIGQKKIEFNIDEHNQGDWGYKFDGKKTKIKKIMSWRGEILFVLYGRQEDFEQGERIAALDAQGKQIWDKGKEFNPLGLIHFMNIRDGYLYIDIGGYGLYLDMKTGIRIKEEIT